MATVKAKSSRVYLTLTQKEQLQRAYDSGMKNTTGACVESIHQLSAKLKLPIDKIKTWIHTKNSNVRRPSADRYSMPPTKMTSWNVFSKKYLEENADGSFPDRIKKASEKWQQVKTDHTEVSKLEREAKLALERRIEMTEDQKWRQAKRLACKMNKLMEDFIKVDVEVAYIGLCIGKQRLLVGGTTKGVNFITPEFEGEFSSFVNGRETEEKINFLNLRKQVQELFRQKYSKAIKKEMRVPYQKIDRGEIEMKLLGVNMCFKRPSSYRLAELTQIMEAKNSIVLLVTNKRKASATQDSILERSSQTNHSKESATEGPVILERSSQTNHSKESATEGPVILERSSHTNHSKESATEGPVILERSSHTNHSKESATEGPVILERSSHTNHSKESATEGPVILERSSHTNHSKESATEGPVILGRSSHTNHSKESATEGPVILERSSHTNHSKESATEGPVILERSSQTNHSKESATEDLITEQSIKYSEKPETATKDRQKKKKRGQAGVEESKNKQKKKKTGHAVTVDCTPCGMCGRRFNTTKSDWTQCISCNIWRHDGCHLKHLSTCDDGLIKKI